MSQAGFNAMVGGTAPAASLSRTHATTQAQINNAAPNNAMPYPKMGMDASVRDELNSMLSQATPATKRRNLFAFNPQQAQANTAQSAQANSSVPSFTQSAPSAQAPSVFAQPSAQDAVANVQQATLATQNVSSFNQPQVQDVSQVAQAGMGQTTQAVQADIVQATQATLAQQAQANVAQSATQPIVPNPQQAQAAAQILQQGVAQSLQQEAAQALQQATQDKLSAPSPFNTAASLQHASVPAGISLPPAKTNDIDQQLDRLPSFGALSARPPVEEQSLIAKQVQGLVPTVQPNTTVVQQANVAHQDATSATKTYHSGVEWLTPQEQRDFLKSVEQGPEAMAAQISYLTKKLNLNEQNSQNIWALANKLMDSYNRVQQSRRDLAEAEASERLAIQKLNAMQQQKQYIQQQQMQQEQFMAQQRQMAAFNNANAYTQATASYQGMNQPVSSQPMSQYGQVASNKRDSYAQANQGAQPSYMFSAQPYQQQASDQGQYAQNAGQAQTNQAAFNQGGQSSAMSYQQEQYNTYAQYQSAPQGQNGSAIAQGLYASQGQNGQPNTQAQYASPAQGTQALAQGQTNVAKAHAAQGQYPTQGATQPNTASSQYGVPNQNQYAMAQQSTVTQGAQQGYMPSQQAYAQQPYAQGQYGQNATQAQTKQGAFNQGAQSNAMSSAQGQYNPYAQYQSDPQGQNRQPHTQAQYAPQGQDRQAFAQGQANVTQPHTAQAQYPNQGATQPNTASSQYGAPHQNQYAMAQQPAFNQVAQQGYMPSQQPYAQQSYAQGQYGQNATQAQTKQRAFNQGGQSSAQPSAQGQYNPYAQYQSAPQAQTAQTLNQGAHGQALNQGQAGQTLNQGAHGQALNQGQAGQTFNQGANGQALNQGAYGQAGAQTNAFGQYGAFNQNQYGTPNQSQYGTSGQNQYASPNQNQYGTGAYQQPNMNPNAQGYASAPALNAHQAQANQPSASFKQQGNSANFSQAPMEGNLGFNQAHKDFVPPSSVNHASWQMPQTRAENFDPYAYPEFMQGDVSAFAGMGQGPQGGVGEGFNLPTRQQRAQAAANSATLDATLNQGKNQQVQEASQNSRPKAERLAGDISAGQNTTANTSALSTSSQPTLSQDPNVYSGLKSNLPEYRFAQNISGEEQAQSINIKIENLQSKLNLANLNHERTQQELMQRDYYFEVLKGIADIIYDLHEASNALNSEDHGSKAEQIKIDNILANLADDMIRAKERALAGETVASGDKFAKADMQSTLEKTPHQDKSASTASSQTVPNLEQTQLGDTKFELAQQGIDGMDVNDPRYLGAQLAGSVSLQSGERVSELGQSSVGVANNPSATNQTSVSQNAQSQDGIATESANLESSAATLNLQNTTQVPSSGAMSQPNTTVEAVANTTVAELAKTTASFDPNKAQTSRISTLSPEAPSGAKVTANQIVEQNAALQQQSAITQPSGQPQQSLNSLVSALKHQEGHGDFNIDDVFGSSFSDKSALQITQASQAENIPTLTQPGGSSPYPSDLPAWELQENKLQQGSIAPTQDANLGSGFLPAQSQLPSQPQQEPVVESVTHDALDRCGVNLNNGVEQGKSTQAPSGAPELSGTAVDVSAVTPANPFAEQKILSPSAALAAKEALAAQQAATTNQYSASMQSMGQQPSADLNLASAPAYVGVEAQAQGQAQVQVQAQVQAQAQAQAPNNAPVPTPTSRFGQASTPSSGLNLGPIDEDERKQLKRKLEQQSFDTLDALDRQINSEIEKQVVYAPSPWELAAQASVVQVGDTDLPVEHIKVSAPVPINRNSQLGNLHEDIQEPPLSNAFMDSFFGFELKMEQLADYVAKYPATLQEQQLQKQQGNQRFARLQQTNPNLGKLTVAYQRYLYQHNAQALGALPKEDSTASLPQETKLNATQQVNENVQQTVTNQLVATSKQVATNHGGAVASVPAQNASALPQNAMTQSVSSLGESEGAKTNATAHNLTTDAVNSASLEQSVENSAQQNAQANYESFDYDSEYEGYDDYDEPAHINKAAYMEALEVLERNEEEDDDFGQRHSFTDMELDLSSLDRSKPDDEADSRELNIDYEDDEAKQPVTEIDEDGLLVNKQVYQVVTIPGKRLLNQEDYLEMIMDKDPWYSLIVSVFPDKGLFYGLLVNIERQIDPQDPNHWILHVDKSQEIGGFSSNLWKEIQEKMEEFLKVSLRFDFVSLAEPSPNCPSAVAERLEMEMINKARDKFTTIGGLMELMHMMQDEVSQIGVELYTDVPEEPEL